MKKHIAEQPEFDAVITATKAKRFTVTLTFSKEEWNALEAWRKHTEKAASIGTLTLAQVCKGTLMNALANEGIDYVPEAKQRAK